ncbi:hypothetical protein AVMA1855_15395 [Acidovorax sp. SUPP1855]|uniref:hypothetical protein n=1 Tax=Acidovorax sp. SUPP1855 TaxID=431774 RepID=UPI0023DE695D|nr:hypothetical protein [Acidovorax sp. SUPP1855]GKS85553.1 hypothetical protein AVMA1855_15395 [Acidovorax sp. SUPP1855]
MNKYILLTALLAPFAAHSAGNELAELKNKNLVLSTNADTCVLIGRTAFVEARTAARPIATSEAEVCVVEGKDAAKTAHAEMKSAFKKKAQTELTEWRLEWMATFDAAVPKVGDSESTYVSRVKAARSNVDRATNKIEIALE